MTRSSYSPEGHSLGGRIRQKSRDLPSFEVHLAHERMAFVYQRLSTHEQIRRSIYSLQMQDALADLAREEGYPEHLVHVEKRDLGVSGTYGSDRREGLAHLIRLIEVDQVEAIFTVHTSRLFRDQTLIDGLAFAELCKQHGVVIVMPNMRLNLRDKMHMRIFRMELERSADELELLNLRLHQTLAFKARQGYYAGGPIQIGYVLDIDQSSPTYQKLKPYQPHAKIVQQMFEMMYEYDGSQRRVARELNDQGVRFPFFTDDVAPTMVSEKKRSIVRRYLKDDDGYIITPHAVHNITTNPVYIGWWLWAGEVISTSNHEAIVSQELFWAVQDKVSNRQKSGPRSPKRPSILGGLLYCNNHNGQLSYVTTSTPHKEGRWQLYKCAFDYERGQSSKTCFCVATSVLDAPISNFVIRQCMMSSYAHRVVDFLEREHQEATEKVELNKREFQRLTREIENLKANLALTRTETQVALILEEIERRLEKRKELTDLSRQPTGRPMMEAEVETVRGLLENLPALWPQFDAITKNEFLRVILERIVLVHDRHSITAQIIWRTGLVHTIRIKRPLVNFNQEKKWTAKEINTIKQHYRTTERQELLRLLPNRTLAGIWKKAGELGLEREVPWTREKVAPVRWTPEEDALLADYYAGRISVEEAMQRIGRSYSGLMSRGHKLGYKLDRTFKRRNGIVDPDTIEWEVIDCGADQGGGNSSVQLPTAPLSCVSASTVRMP